MSNVLERFRKTSQMEFYNNGQKLLHEACTFLMNEKNIPKRHRYLYTYPIINLIQHMIDTYMLANSIYAIPPMVERKKQLYQESIDLIDPIFLRLQNAVNDLWRIDFSHAEGQTRERKKKVESALERITALLIRQEELLRGCKRSVKPIYQNRTQHNQNA